VNAGAILLCAGRGERLGWSGGKALAPLAGRPLFTWSLDALERTPSIAGIVVVGPVSALRAAHAASGTPASRVIAWCEGGPERQDSVARGLAALPPSFDLVAIHDAARALVTPELVARCIADAMECGATLAAIPIDDTVKRVSVGVVESTVPRAGLWRAQTPQVFRRDWIEAAHAQTSGRATDDAALVEAAGHRVKVTMGDPLNFKITTAADLELAAALLVSRTSRA
jgi:2-C-methyl-D-erythritol 4-phosphate cytidylyltransferase